jgi:hypothetical protein
MEAPTARTPARPVPTSASKPTPSPAVLAVWEAEDGRCEACGRKLSAPPWRILQALIAVYPKAVSRGWRAGCCERPVRQLQRLR